MSMASACYGEAGSEPAIDMPIEKLQALPLDAKVTYTKLIIQRFYVQMKGKVYVSFSGGKDSTVLLDLVRSLYPEVPAVYSDTGLEFPEIREFVKSTPNVEIVRPERSFREVIRTEGYPVISKEVARTICDARRGKEWALRQLSKTKEESRYAQGHYAWLMDAPFPISSKCCNVLKKKPMHDYQMRTGRYPIIGTKGVDSTLRNTMLRKCGEVQHDRCTPLGIWTDEDVWAYIRSKDLPYCPIYDMGWSATGCIFCLFGIRYDPDRFLKLKATHPKQWEYCMRPLDQGGLGMQTVCDFLGVPSGCGQTNLLEFAKEMNRHESSQD